MPRETHSTRIDPNDTYTWAFGYWVWRLNGLAAMIGFVAFFVWRTIVALSVIQQDYDMHPSGLLDGTVFDDGSGLLVRRFSEAQVRAYL